MAWSVRRRALIAGAVGMLAAAVGLFAADRLPWAGADAGALPACRDCNVIMISLSNVSAEHMSLHGYARPTTPSLERWAEDGVTFTRAFSQTSWTLPVATSLFTSLYPYTHGVMHRHTQNSLDPSIPTLAELLKSRGYVTAAFTGGLDYSGRFGHMRGFDEVEEITDDYAASIATSGFGTNLAKARAWLDRHVDQKRFLFLHAYDTHCPFQPPEAVRGTFASPEGKEITVDPRLCLRGYKDADSGGYTAHYYKDGGRQAVKLTQDDIDYLRDSYDEEILAVDRLVGSFLAQLPAALVANSVIVVFSDHGEMFARHGRFGRAGTVRGTLYDDVLHVPLVIRIPGQRGRVVDGLVQLIDVMPTLLSLLGPDERRPAPRLQGRDLLPLIAGSVDQVNPYVYTGAHFGLSERSASRHLYSWKSVAESVRSRELKLIHEVRFDKEAGEGAPGEETFELYDLARDPGEEQNLVDERPELARELRAELGAFRSAAESFLPATPPASQPLPESLAEEARKRGYW